MNPPLPIPEKVTEHDSCKYFTEAQLLAYRAEVIEMCAEEFDKLYLLSGQEVGPAIRSLK